jgi:hypothetical protein
LGVYKVQEIIKENFVTNVVHVEMERHHLYIACHVIRVANVVATYWAKHEIVHNDMV